MTSEERLSKVQVKVEQARKNFHDLGGEVRSFLGSQPYQIGTRRDPATRRMVYYLVSVQPIPPVIAAITGDIIHNLRSALDHLAYQLVTMGTGGKGPYRHVYFPISESAKKHKTEGLKKIQGMSLEAKKAIEALRPYQGGNDMLWHIHSLDNIDKHRLLITVGSAYRSFNIGSLLKRSLKQEGEVGFSNLDNFPFSNLALKPADRLFPLKAGDELFMDLPDAEVDENLKFQFEIAFGEPEVFDGKPLLETLEQMIKTVHDIILSFKEFLR
jgi:hypothetical protein